MMLSVMWKCEDKVKKKKTKMNLLYQKIREKE